MALIQQPPGIRATSLGGKWTFCRGNGGANYVMNDFASFEQRLGPHVLAVVRQELFYKMRQAELGKLTYGPGPEHDVQQMTVAQDVLELRLSDRSGDESNLLHLRFFFSEPLHRPGLLVGLGLLWKRPGPAGLEEQNDAAKVASLRLAEFTLREDY